MINHKSTKNKGSEYMKIRIIHLLCALQFFSIPLPTSCMAWSDSIGWGDHSKYMLQTCLVVLGTIITYEKLKSWWAPPTKIDCGELECASRLRNLFNQPCVKELEDLRKQITPLIEIEGKINPLIELYEAFSKDMENFAKNELGRCKQAFESQQEQLAKYQVPIQKIEKIIDSLDADVARLKQITGNGIRLNQVPSTLTEAYLRLNRNISSVNKRLKALEEALEQQAATSNSLATSR